MSEFTAQANLSIHVPDSEIRREAARIEDGLSDLSVDLSPGVTRSVDNPPGGRTLGRTLETMKQLDGTRNDHLADIKELLDDPPGGGGGSTAGSRAVAVAGGAVSVGHSMVQRPGLG